MSADTPDGTESVGGVVSVKVTVTLKVPSGLVLPLLSVAWQWTWVVPTGNWDPEAGLQLTKGLGSTASVAEGALYVATAPLGFEVGTEMSPGSDPRVGGVVSCTVTLNDPAGVPSSSLVHVTFVVPRGNTEPDAGVQVTPPPASKVTVAPVGPVASTVTSPGKSRARAEARGAAQKSIAPQIIKSRRSLKSRDP